MAKDRADRQDRLKKEYRIANATVGDRPQIEDELEDELDLFGDKELTRDGRKLRKMMRKRRGSEDLFDMSDDVSRQSIPIGLSLSAGF